MPVDERGGFTIEVLQPPLPPPLVDELLELWSHAEIFGHAPDDGEGGVRAVLSGHEADDNRDVLYVARVDGALAGSTKLCVSTDPHPWFGGLGEVSTLPEFRRRGIAEALCTRAREDFISVGGKMLVLGTVNPLAARRYFAIGYRRMPGAHDRLLAFFPGRRCHTDAPAAASQAPTAGGTTARTSAARRSGRWTSSAASRRSRCR